MSKPNFFVIGAPKCGTTALMQYLGEHENIFVSNPKEPFYWCSESPGLTEYTRIQTLADYEQLFTGVAQKHLAVGEGSTEYLRSPNAVRDILAYNPNARFIVMLRNPVDLVYSFHGTQLLTMSEDVADFETAWRLQEERAEGKRIPSGCLDPRLIRYREVGQLGSQLARFYELVPETQRMVIIFDDFAANTKAVYEQVLEFLEVPKDDRSEFPKVHEARRQRFRWVHRIIRRPPRLLAGPVMACRRALNKSKSGLVPAIKSAFANKTPREKLSPEFREELICEFESEVKLLSDLLGRNLSNWR